MHAATTIHHGVRRRRGELVFAHAGFGARGDRAQRIHRQFSGFRHGADFLGTLEVGQLMHQHRLQHEVGLRHVLLHFQIGVHAHELRAGAVGGSDADAPLL